CAGGDTDAGIASIRVEKALAIGVHTDILFPIQQQRQISDGLLNGGAESSFVPLESPQGHDAFLVDFERFGPPVRAFLAALWLALISSIARETLPLVLRLSCEFIPAWHWNHADCGVQAPCLFRPDGTLAAPRLANNSTDRPTKPATGPGTERRGCG